MFRVGEVLVEPRVGTPGAFSRSGPGCQTPLPHWPTMKDTSRFEDVNPAIEWTDCGNEIADMGGLSEYVSLLRAEVHHMRVGLSRAAWGALNGRAWLAPPAEGESRPSDEDILGALDMTVTPAGTTAKDATLRNSLVTLLAALDAADHAALTVWLARVNAQDPEKTS